MTCTSSHNPLTPFLSSQGYLIIDGGFATELENRGENLNDSLWSAKVLLDDKKHYLLEEIHRDYLESGADVVISCSYQASFHRLEERGYSHAEAENILRKSVEIAGKARDLFYEQYVSNGDRNGNSRKRLRPLVAASVGSYGAYLTHGAEYKGDYSLSREQLKDFHRPRIAALLAAGPDLLACETIPCLLEGEALVELLAEFPDSKAWLSFSCKDGSSCCHGEPFEQCVALANRSEQVVAIGVNCSSPAHIDGLLKKAIKVTSKPLLAYPNSGEGWDGESHQWVPADVAGVDSFANLAVGWYTSGCKLIGGCCRTTPGHIQAISKRLSSIGKSP